MPSKWTAFLSRGQNCTATARYLIFGPPKSKQKARCPARYKRRFKRVFLQLALRAQTNKNTFPFKPPFIGNGENGQGKKVLLGIRCKTKTPVPFKRGGCFKNLSGILIQLALLSYRAIALTGQPGLLCISCPARLALTEQSRSPGRCRRRRRIQHIWCRQCVFCRLVR